MEETNKHVEEKKIESHGHIEDYEHKAVVEHEHKGETKHNHKTVETIFREFKENNR